MKVDHKYLKIEDLEQVVADLIRYQKEGGTLSWKDQGFEFISNT